MARLILDKCNHLENIKKNGKNREFSNSQIEEMKCYYKKAEKENSVQVNAILASGREAASKIFIAN